MQNNRWCYKSILQELCCCRIENYLSGKHEIINNLNEFFVIRYEHTLLGASKNATDRIHSDFLDLKVGKLVFDVTSMLYYVGNETLETEKMFPTKSPFVI